MKSIVEENALRILSAYLEHNNCRRTPERIAVLKAVYAFKTHFSVKELIDSMQNSKFPVSRGTVYNAMRLFIRLNIVVCHKLKDGMRYEACSSKGDCRRICTVCGKEMDVRIAGLDALVENTHLMRFRKEHYSLFIYGVCSSCQAAITRRKKKENNNKK